MKFNSRFPQGGSHKNFGYSTGSETNLGIFDLDFRSSTTRFLIKTGRFLRICQNYSKMFATIKQMKINAIVNSSPSSTNMSPHNIRIIVSLIFSVRFFSFWITQKFVFISFFFSIVFSMILDSNLFPNSSPLNSSRQPEFESRTLGDILWPFYDISYTCMSSKFTTSAESSEFTFLFNIYELFLENFSIWYLNFSPIKLNSFLIHLILAYAWFF